MGADSDNMENEAKRVENPDPAPSEERAGEDEFRAFIRVENRIDAITFLGSFFFFWWRPSPVIAITLWGYMAARQIVMRKFRGGLGELWVKVLLVAGFAGAAWLAAGTEAATVFLFVVFIRTASFSRPLSLTQRSPRTHPLPLADTSDAEPETAEAPGGEAKKTAPNRILDQMEKFFR
jgi:hypothetical protein